MENSKLSILLSKFTKQEFKGFGKFLKSPYFNISERNLGAFYDVVKSFYPDFKISKEGIYGRIYPGKVYNDKTMKNILTDALKSAEEFLTYRFFESRKELKSNIKAEALLAKSMEKEFLKTIEMTEGLLDSDKMGSEDYFINYRKLHQLKMTYSKSFYKAKSETEHILESVEYLAALLLKDLSNILVNEQLSVYLNTAAVKSPLIDLLLDNFRMESFMKKLEQLNHKFYPFVAFRYYLYKDLCETDNFEYFYKLKDIVYRHIESFSRETQFEATWAIINSCAMTSRRSITEMRRESLNMLVFQLKKGLHIPPGNNYYLIAAFNQFLSEALYFKEYELVEKVLSEHCDELEPGIREDMKNWGYGSLYFDKKDYVKALSFTSKINFKEPNFKVQAKFLLFKIFYEMDLPEQAVSIVNTSLHTLQLEELSTEVRKRYEMSFKNARKLINIKNKYSREDAELLRTKIKSQTFIGKAWINKMLEDLS